MNSNYFFLMHQNDIVVPLEIEEESGKILTVGKARREELMPLGTNRSKKDFLKWWNRRAVPKTRNGVAAALHFWGITSTESLLVQNLALSLTDAYWIAPADQDISWDSVNLFDHAFSDTIGEFQFSQNETDLDLQQDGGYMPSASLQGELTKKWMIAKDGTRYLVKGNYGRSCQQSLNEVLATELHGMQKRVSYTSYHLVNLHTAEGDMLGCACDNFAGKKLEFIPAIDINSDGKRPNDMSEYEYFIRQCVRYGLGENVVREFLEYQILTDFLLTNTDRHFHNFGVLRDVDTLRFVSMAPIFDSGNSMFWNYTNLDKVNLADITVSSFKKKEIQLLKYVKDRSNIDLSKIPEEDFLQGLYGRDPAMDEKRVGQVIALYQKKAQMLEEFQQGQDFHLRFSSKIKK